MLLEPQIFHKLHNFDDQIISPSYVSKPMIQHRVRILTHKYLAKDFTNFNQELSGDQAPAWEVCEELEPTSLVGTYCLSTDAHLG